MAHLLLIDDEKTLREVITKRLEREGYKVTTYSDAAPAIELAPLEQMDLVITDLVMPTSGEKVIEAVRARQLKVPIIVLSGNLRAGDRQHLEQLGANFILPKPFRLMALLTVIEQLLRESG